MDIYTNKQKSDRISIWKNRGLIYHDYDDLFEVYRRTLNCQHCNKEFKNKKDRCMDHNHETGLFRKIVCNKCNTLNSYINYPNGREKLYKHANEKIKCECGSIITRRGISQHKKTAKHIDWWLNNVD